MAINYEKVGWDTTKFVGPTNMNQMDDGIKAACDGVDALNTAMGSADISGVGDGTVKGAIKEVNNNFSNFVCKQVYTSVTGIIPVGVSEVVFDIPVVKGCKPLMFIANPHAWYVGYAPIGGSSSGFINSDSTSLNLQYYTSSEINSEGGSCSATILYVPT